MSEQTAIRGHLCTARICRSGGKRVPSAVEVVVDGAAPEQQQLLREAISICTLPQPQREAQLEMANHQYADAVAALSAVPLTMDAAWEA